MSGKTEVLDPWHVRGDIPQDTIAGVATLHEDVHTEATESRLGDCKIEFPLVYEMLPLRVGHERVSGLLHRLGGEHLLVDRQDLAFNLDLDRRIGSE